MAVAVVVLTSLVLLAAFRLLAASASPPKLSSASSSAGSAASASTSGSSSSSSAPLLPLSIFFGSQSGTAEAFARELAEEAKVLGFGATVKDLEDYDCDELSAEKFAVFLMATFGEGEPTDNAASFYEWLCSDARAVESEVKGVRFAVFALGNRQYEHFCLIGRRVDERMHLLGGERLVALGEGDDDGSLEGDFKAWKAAFWEATNATFGTTAAAAGEGGEVKAFVSSFVLEPLPPSQQAVQRAKYQGGLHSLVTDPKHRVVVAPVVDNRELRQSCEDDGSTRHLEIDLSHVSLPYLTADNCGVYPRNDHKTVAYLLRRLQLDGAQLLVMKGNGSKRSFLPSPCSVQDILLHYLDVSFVPRPSQLPQLSLYCRAEAESGRADRALLLYWARQGQDEYLREQRTLVELLQDLPSFSPPLQDLVDFVPHLAPRFYTISSSSLVQPKRLSLTVSVLTHHKTRGRKQRGLCSGYLASLRPDKDSVAIFIRPSGFRLPKARPSSTPPAASTAAAGGAAVSAAPPVSSPAVASLPPVLMVGPGTGLAPFRGFLQEATAQKGGLTPPVHSNGAGNEVVAAPPPPPPCGYGDLHLFFGCRSSTKDFIYREELLRAVEEKVLAALHVAFSREQVQGVDSTASESAISASATAAATASLAASSLDSSHAHHFTNKVTGKVYVQDRMRGARESLWDALHTRKGYLFVCGGTAMGRSVREVLLEVCRERGGLTAQQAELYIKRMQEQKRYVQELWS